MSVQKVRSRNEGDGSTASRLVEPELLDELPAEDPTAIQSRRDLRRINWIMGNGRLLANRIRTVPGSIAELGGGDGTLLLKVVRRLGQPKVEGRITVVDRARLLSQATVREFGAVGWKIQVVQADVFTWLKAAEPVDLILANLFLHHFVDRSLRDLFDLIAAKTESFVACDPRRVRFPRLAGELVRFLGCNRVTRHDAIASIRAGFIGQELSALWPKGAGWQLTEGSAGLFSHAFAARRGSA